MFLATAGEARGSGYNKVVKLYAGNTVAVFPVNFILWLDLLCRLHSTAYDVECEWVAPCSGLMVYLKMCFIFFRPAPIPQSFCDSF